MVLQQQAQAVQALTGALPLMRRLVWLVQDVAHHIPAPGEGLLVAV